MGATLNALRISPAESVSYSMVTTYLLSEEIAPTPGVALGANSLPAPPSVDASQMPLVESVTAYVNHLPSSERSLNTSPLPLVSCFRPVSYTHLTLPTSD